jgi:hypothetical protein
MVDLTSMLSVWGRGGSIRNARFWKSAEDGTCGFLTSMSPRPRPYTRDAPEEFPADVQAGRVRVWRGVEQALSLVNE